jgi:hypothetical protein
MGTPKWLLRGEKALYIAEFARAGDSISPLGADGQWRALRRGLAKRQNLSLAAVGDRIFIVPPHALPRIPVLTAMAEAAALARNEGAMAGLCDLLSDLGLTGAREEMLEAAASRPVTGPFRPPMPPPGADPHDRRLALAARCPLPVPGGSLGCRWHRRRPIPSRA